MKAPKKKPPDEDEAQSRRFIEEAKKLEDAGELNLTEGEVKLERLISRVTTSHQTKAAK